MNISVDLNTDWEICDDLYHRDGHLYMFMVQLKEDNSNCMIIQAESLWTNENHNIILDYIKQMDIDMETFREIRGFKQVKCIMLMRSACEAALSLYEIDAKKDEKKSKTNKLKEKIRRDWLYPDQLEELDDEELEEWIDYLKEIWDWDNDE
jgi:hypothetical protein